MAIRGYMRLFDSPYRFVWPRICHSVRRAFVTPAVVESSRAGTVEVLETELLPEIYSPSTEKISPLSAKPRKSDVPETVKTLIRSETIALNEQVIRRHARLPASGKGVPKLVLLDGLKGVGKSTILQQAVASARSSDFVVMYIPNARHWTDGPGFFCPKVTGEMDPVKHGISAIRYYDRPMQIHQIFTNLLNAHADTLHEIPCTPKLATKSTESCDTLHDLVTHGRNLIDEIDSNWYENPSLAADAFHQTILELSTNPDVPFAIVVDDYHTLIGLTCMEDERRRRLHSNCIRTIAEFFGRSAIERTADRMNRGFVLIGAEANPPFMSWRSSRVLGTSDYVLNDSIRRDPSGSVWFEGLRLRAAHADKLDAMHIRVSECIPGELKAMCATFAPRGLGRDAGQPDKKGMSDRLVMLSGGRGNVMRAIFDSR